MRRGFTLMEVMVAVVVLSIGAAGIGHVISGYLQIKDREANRGRALLEAVSLMEEQVATPSPCVEAKKDTADTSLVTVPVKRQKIEFSLSYERIPGGPPLQWVVVRETSGYWNNLALKRIAKCVETDSH